ncbi:MAG: hypothetical protein ACODAU_12745 [Myxococcota bacterium]
MELEGFVERFVVPAILMVALAASLSLLAMFFVAPARDWAMRSVCGGEAGEVTLHDHPFSRAGERQRVLTITCPASADEGSVTFQVFGLLFGVCMAPAAVAIALPRWIRHRRVAALRRENLDRIRRSRRGSRCSVQGSGGRARR